MRYSKYNARGADLDGHHFDSQAELARYLELRILEKNGDIDDLKVHPVYVLLPSFEYKGKRIRAVTYEADFSYNEIEEGDIYGASVIEDVKGAETELFKVKAKFLMAQLAQLGEHVEFRIIK